MAESDNMSSELPPAKRVVFYKSGNTSYTGLKVAVDRRETIQSLTTTLSRKTDIGVRSIYTPGATTRVTSLEDLTDGQFYLVSSVGKAVPTKVEQIRNRKIWNNIRSNGDSSGGSKSDSETREGGAARRRKTHSPHPPLSDDSKKRKDVRRVQSHPKAATRSAPKRVVVFRNGNPHLKHMVLLNVRSKYEFEHLMMDISDMFHVKVHKLFTMEGFKVGKSLYRNAYTDRNQNSLSSSSSNVVMPLERSAIGCRSGVIPPFFIGFL